jgi:hypothetical protein
MLEVLLNEGPTYGFHLKRSKGVYLLGRCESNAVAQARKQSLIARFNIAADIIKIHPDNGGDPAEYGGKALGSFIGTDEYCRAQLVKKSKEFQATADRIPTVQSKQTQFLLLKWCFSQKLIYWQRTMPPYLIKHSIEADFTRQKLEVLASILECEVDDINCKTRELAQLRIDDGGLGLSFSQDVTYAAYAASYVENALAMQSLFTQPKSYADVTIQDRDIPSAAAFRHAMEHISHASGHEHTFVSLSKKLSEIRSSSPSSVHKTMQQTLTRLFQPVNKQRMIDLLKDPREMAWYVSTATKEAGLWLNVAPKGDMHTFANAPFVVALRLRLFMAQKFILQGTKCDCMSSTSKQCRIVDQEAIHWTTGCSYDGVRIATHDLVRDHIGKILRYCGANTRSEERFAMQTPIRPDSNERPDLTVHNLAESNKPHFLDIQITSPVPACGGPISAAHAQTPLRAASSAAKDKERKYRDAVQATGFGFIPIIFETTGSMTSDTLKLLRNNIQAAAKDKGIPFGTLWQFWISSLQVVLQRSLAAGILKRSSSLRGRTTGTFETSQWHIAEFDYRNTHTR